ncbi:MAG: hypothetical protein CMC04_00620 [Flavobacteriaceae bacterium]|nr:hypothetical protein [Flavobacteriaceae bacterium]
MKNIAKLYIVLLILIGFYPDNSNPIDYKALHWLMYSVLNTLFLVYFIINYKKISLPKSPVLISYLCFFVVSCLSIFVAINKTESIVRLTDFYVITSTLFICYIFIKQKLFSIKFILFAVLIKLSIELVQLYYQLYYYTSGFQYSFYGGQFSQYLKSNYGNKNVTSFAFLIQSSIAMISLSYTKSRFIKFLISLIIFATIYSLYLISTRAVLLSIVLGLIVISVFAIYKFFRLKSISNSDIKKIVLYFSIVFSSYMIFNLTNTDDNIIVAERVSGLTNIVQDESLSNRLRYWTHAFNSIRENPILGVGVGNWRIVSTKYDSQNIYSYVVPYATHNDFLEIFAEIGTLGFISYIAFFFFLFQKNFKNLIKWTNSNITINHLFLLLCLMYFILDSSINFPLSRPLMQMVLILFIVLNELINSNKVSNED